MAVNSPGLFAFKLVEYPGKLACEIRWNEAFGESSSFTNYLLASHVIFVFVAIVLLVILYSIIVFKLKTQIFPGEQSVNAEQQRAKRNRSVLKMAIAIVVVFFLCWLPSSIIQLLLFFARESDRTLPCGFYLYLDIAYFISLLSFAINPCICFTFSGNYRQGLKRLLKCSNAVQE